MPIDIQGCGTVCIDKVPISLIDSKWYRSKPRSWVNWNRTAFIETGSIEHIQSLPDLPDAQYKSMWPYLKSKIHMSHKCQGRLFLHEGTSISMKLKCILKKTSLSCVKMWPIRPKLGLIPRYLHTSHPFKTIFEHTYAYARWAHMHRFQSVCPSVRCHLTKTQD